MFKMTIISEAMPIRFPSVCANTQGTDRLSPYPFIKLELGKGVVTCFRWIPPGRFLMGSPEDEHGRWEDEGPQHYVTLSHGYWLADAPCTQAEWLAVMGTDPSSFKGSDLPVEQVSWEDCQEYCKRIRSRFPEFEARLPTEAEWEYACRAGTTSAYNDGSACTKLKGNDSGLEKLGWFDKNSEKKTHPVRQKEANCWGLYDMHGNVWEWCADWYGKYSADDQVDFPGRSSGSGRVSRGGSWIFPARSCRSAIRYGWHPGYRYLLLGFRLALGQMSQVGEASGP
jgi:formylglycine-generating enzyme required for sulfatase activity